MKDYFEMSSPCLIGGYPRPMGQFPMMNMGMPSPQMNWHYSHMYQSRMSCPPERRDSAPRCDSRMHLSSPSSDSGVHLSSPSSDSGVHLSSPSSDESERYPSPPIQHAYPSTFQNSNMVNSPSNSSPTLPATVKEEPVDEEDQNREISGSPESTDYTHDSNALKGLEASVEKNLNISESSSQHENDVSDNNIEDYSAVNDYSTPSLNSHGKIKIVRCKPCQATFNTKLDLWTHQRTHIKPDRLLQCNQCPFVTEYKHHLEYHIKNHQGEKPYKCDKCDYKCVNKSMLNSHMKSHSNLHQYRCANCEYTTKYLHSLKIHLRKYSHQPAVILNPDGTPNPLPFIDVYGTKRGPKMKSTEREQGSQTLPSKRTKTENGIPPMAALPGVVPGMVPLPFMSEDQLQLQQMMNQMIFMQTLQNLQMLQNSSVHQSNSPPSLPDNFATASREPKNEMNDSVLDLSKDKSSTSEDSSNASPSSCSPSTTDEEDSENYNLLYNVKVEHSLEDDDTSEPIASTSLVVPQTQQPASTEELRCKHCCITFEDFALFTIHMRFHNFSDPFTCNSCGFKCEDKIEFTMHILTKPH